MDLPFMPAVEARPPLKQHRRINQGLGIIIKGLLMKRFNRENCRPTGQCSGQVLQSGNGQNRFGNKPYRYSELREHHCIF
jgi:hypothetical protein